jgi:glycosyltransferase involved in cell wall biosynthesis
MTTKRETENEEETIDVSVIVTTYNHETSIFRCINSIATQSTKYRFEILIGDDGSSDNTFFTLAHLSGLAPHLIKIFRSDRTQNTFRLGFPTARAIHTELIKMARGRYITFIDGDDFYSDREKIEIQVRFLDENPDYVACCHDTAIWKKSSHFKRHLEKKQRDNEVDFTSVASGDRYFFLPTFVYRRNFPIGEAPAEFSEPFITDYGISLHFLKAGKCRYIDRAMSAYNLSGEGVWSSLSIYEKLLSRLIIREDLLTVYDGKHRKAVWVGWYRNLRELRNVAIKHSIQYKNFPALLRVLTATVRLWIGFPRYFSFVQKYKKDYLKHAKYRTARRIRLFEKQ